MDVRALARADLLWGAAVLAATLLLYGLGARPGLHVGDSPELAAAASTFGVAHPPGYALYTLLTGLGVRALFWLDAAHAANVMSGLYAAGAVTGLWLLLRRLAVPAAACTFGAASLGLGATFLSQAAAAEVYTLDALLLVAALHAAVFVAAGSGRGWLLAGVVIGLWLGHRLNNLLYLPAPALVWMACGGRLGSVRIAPLAGGLALAALPVLYLPLASARDPLVDMGDPETAARLWAVVSAAPFRGLLGGVAPDVALRRVGLFVLSLPMETGLAALAAAAGAWHLWRRRAGRRLLAALILLPVLGVAFAALYDILDHDAYLLPGLVGLCALGGVGAGALLFWVEATARPVMARLTAAALVILGLVGLLLNVGTSSGAGLVRRLAVDTLASVPPNAVLLVQGDTTSGALDYLQAVEGRSPNVVVIRVENLTPWYAGNLARRFPREPWPAFHAAQTPGANAHRIMVALGRARPVYLTLSVDPRVVLPRKSPLGMVPRGLVREVRRKGERVRLGRRALLNARLLQGSVEKLMRPGPRADMDLRSLYLQYALALLQTAEQLGRAGLAPQARACLDALLRMKPNIQDVQLRHEVMIRSGHQVPHLRLEEKARALRWRLGGR